MASTRLAADGRGNFFGVFFRSHCCVETDKSRVDNGNTATYKASCKVFILAQFVLFSYDPTCTSFESARQVDGLTCIIGYDKDHNCRILNHRTASPHALFDVLGLDGGRGKTLSDLVDRDRELPANLAIRTNTCVHTQKYITNAHR